MARKRARSADTSFYVTPEYISDTALILEGDNFHHAVNVLRQDVGSELTVVDGEGRRLNARIESIDKKQALCAILSVDSTERDGGRRVTLGIGMLKAKDRFEFLVEKAVELGVTEIVQLSTVRSEGRPARAERTKRIAIAAMKQSRRSFLPDVNGPVPLSEFVDSRKEGVRIYGSMNVDAPPVLSILSGISSSDDVVVVVGPEGGFDEQEEFALSKSGFQAVTLGARRLRAETAGVAILTALELASHPA